MTSLLKAVRLLPEYHNTRTYGKKLPQLKNLVLRASQPLKADNKLDAKKPEDAMQPPENMASNIFHPASALKGFGHKYSYNGYSFYDLEAVAHKLSGIDLETEQQLSEELQVAKEQQQAEAQKRAN